MRILTRKKKIKQHILFIKLFFFLLLSLPVQTVALKSYETHWSCAIFHLVLKHLKLMGKVILFTSLPEEIWIAQMNTQTLKSPTYHTRLYFLGQNPDRLHLASCWCFLKDAKCPLKGEKPAQDGVKRLSSWNVILESGVNSRGEFQMKDQQEPGGKQMSSRTGSLTPATGK